jgi:replicative DNA helicase
MNLQNIEAEQSVLGGLMMDNSAWDSVCDLIQEEDFSRRDHRVIYRAIATLASQGIPMDTVTLSEWVDKQGLLDDIGGLSYLGSLAANTPTAANIKAYAGIVRERAVFRQLARVATEIGTDVHNPEGCSADELLDRAESRVMAITRINSVNGPKLVRAGITNAVDRLDMRFNNPGELSGLSTGFADIDFKLNGLQSGDMIVVAGRPSMGKTAFAMNIAEYVAVKSEQPVLVFSLEMSSEQVIERSFCSVGGIDFGRFRTGLLKEEEWPKVTAAAQKLYEAPLIVDDTPALSVMEVRARARQAQREHGLALIIVDYLQLMKGAGDNRTNEVSDISRGLKALAKELSVPVIALSQLNRSVEQRPCKRPVMSDLRDSGSIEQDADVVMFIYRDEVYHLDSPDKGIAEIIISKQRNGPLGKVQLTFQGEQVRFRNYEPEPGRAEQKAVKRWSRSFDNALVD